MSILQAIILGAVQGLTEFLPISSQAHLYLVPYFFRWNYQGLGFDVALHWGTLLAVLIVFGKDYWRFVTRERVMVWYLVLGTLPAVAAGLLLRQYAEETFRNPLIMVFTLAGFGLLLWVAERKNAGTGEVGLNWKTVVLIGVAQAVAIIPGVSRSGVTITAALMFAAMSREQAARFSFLLSGPIIFGAGLLELPTLGTVSIPLLAGFISAVFFGTVAIRFLLNYLAKRGFGVFVWYRLALAAIIALTVLTR